jgi:hypothetical protein
MTVHGKRKISAQAKLRKTRMRAMAYLFMKNTSLKKLTMKNEQ